MEERRAAIYTYGAKKLEVCDGDDPSTDDYKSTILIQRKLTDHKYKKFSRRESAVQRIMAKLYVSSHTSLK